MHTLILSTPREETAQALGVGFWLFVRNFKGPWQLEPSLECVCVGEQVGVEGDVLLEFLTP